MPTGLHAYMHTCLQALGGVRFFSQLIVLRLTSATTLSVIHVAAHALIVSIAIPLFHTNVSPFLIVGFTTTLVSAFLYTYVKTTEVSKEQHSEEEDPSPQLVTHGAPPTVTDEAEVQVRESGGVSMSGDGVDTQRR